VLTRDTTTQDASNRGLSQTHVASPTSVPSRAAQVGKRRADMGAGIIEEQAASERANYRGYYSRCTVLLDSYYTIHYYITNLMSGFLSTWVGLPTNWVGLLSKGVGLLLGERVLENMPIPLFEHSLKFIARGRIVRAYGT